MTTDKKMADGNLTFDDERFAVSLSKIYDVGFHAEKADGEDTVYVSDMYPGIEVKIIRHGYTESTYLDNDLKYVLSSQKLEAHRGIFDEHGVELIPYVFGRTEEEPEGYGTYYSVLITDENQENAAKAIAEFILTTLQEDMRADGKSCWSSVDGSIFLVTKDCETGETKSLRNVPFSLNPDYSWIFDETVTNEEILEEIKQVLESVVETYEKL